MTFGSPIFLTKSVAFIVFVFRPISCCTEPWYIESLKYSAISGNLVIGRVEESDGADGKIYKCEAENPYRRGSYFGSPTRLIVKPSKAANCSDVTHCNDVIMSAIASQITSLTIVYSTVYSGTDQRKHQSSASLAIVRGIHRWPMNSPHIGPVTRKIFHLMTSSCYASWHLK